MPAPGSPAARVTLAALEADPHPVLARLRASSPVSWVPVLGAWLVTGYDLAVEVLRDARTFTVDDPRFSTAKVVGPSMTTEGMIANALLHLLSSPAQLELVLADRGLVPAAVVDRYATSDAPRTRTGRRSGPNSAARTTRAS